MPRYVFKSADGKLDELELSMAYVQEHGVPESIVVGLQVYKRVFTAAPVHFKGSGFYSTSSRA